MKELDVSHRVFRVSDFLGWQREGSLRLSPSFQRRAVWRKPAKSYLIDTIVRGLPTPVIFIRERLDLDLEKTVREVVDGQQRLRTVFSYIDRASLSDFKPDVDDFAVSKRHNPDLAGRKFAELDNATKVRILSYEFSTQVLPSSVDDRDVLQIFARLNSTGDQLNGQELRNAAYFGEFKSLMYELALQQLDRWREWRIFSEQQLARMKEVELTSDLVLTMIDGIYGKTQKKIDAVYKQFDEEYPYRFETERRFNEVMDVIDRVLGFAIPETVWVRDVFFYSLFAYLYDLSYELDSGLDGKFPRKKLDLDRLTDCLLSVSGDFEERDVPEHVMDAVSRASSDVGRRRTRQDYLRSVCS